MKIDVFPITNQADLDEALKARLARHCAKHREELEAFKAQYDKQHREQLELQRKEHQAHSSEQADRIDRLTAALAFAEARAIATELGFRNPETAVRVITPTGWSYSSSHVDLAAIRERLAELAQAEPYMTHHQPTPGELR